MPATRPPAGPSAYGGSCYLNSAAIAAQALRDAGAPRVAVIDVDAHHCNGTQAIFYERADVYVGSLHVDPGAGWFPHYVGYADERGAGDADWLAAVEVLCGEARSHGAEAIVVSLGVDAAAADPESPLCVSADAYRLACERIAALAPAVVVQEGGYDLDSLGSLVMAALEGFRA